MFVMDWFAFAGEDSLIESSRPCISLIIATAEEACKIWNRDAQSEFYDEHKKNRHRRWSSWQKHGMETISVCINPISVLSAEIDVTFKA